MYDDPESFESEWVNFNRDEQDGKDKKPCGIYPLYPVHPC
jgi:hypothetical protein